MHLSLVGLTSAMSEDQTFCVVFHVFVKWRNLIFSLIHLAYPSPNFYANGAQSGKFCLNSRIWAHYLIQLGPRNLISIRRLDGLELLKIVLLCWNLTLWCSVGPRCCEIVKKIHFRSNLRWWTDVTQTDYIVKSQSVANCSISLKFSNVDALWVLRSRAMIEINLPWSLTWYGPKFLVLKSL